MVYWAVEMKIVEEGYSAGHDTIRTLEIGGSAPVTAVDGVVSAQGTADWTDTCAGGKQGDGFQPCLVAGLTDAELAGYSHTGTLDWKMTFVP
jgi:hypothetical protein